MAKAKKTEPTVTNTVQADVVVDSTPSKTTKGKSSKKAAPAQVEVVPEVAQVTQVDTAKVDAVVDSEFSFTDTFTEFMAKLQTIATQINSLKTEFRTLEKKATRELKLAQKASAKKKRKTTNRSPSGFVKPTLISNELATFLKKPIGTEMARTEVTREINSYIRAHNLQDKNNGRKINPDSSLATLLKIGNDEELTYFNLQKYMSPHFAKAGGPALNASSSK